MKVRHLGLLCVLCLTLASCVKSESKKINVNIPTFEPVQIGKDVSGFRCDVVSESEQKEVLILLTDQADGKKTVQFFDFISATRISSALAKIGDYTLLSFSLNPASSDGKLRSDKAALLNSHSELLVEDGKVVGINGFLTVDEEMNGILEQTVQYINEDGSFNTIDLKEIAKIENCKVDVVKKI